VTLRLGVCALRVLLCEQILALEKLDHSLNRLLQHCNDFARLKMTQAYKARHAIFFVSLVVNVAAVEKHCV
jgi:hypothetical protein